MSVRNGIPVVTEDVNVSIRQHSTSVEDWQFKSLASELHVWADRFVSEFDLKIPVPAIAIEQTRKRALGTYLGGRDGYGVGHKIQLNTLYLARTKLDVLRTLLHELLHEWQYTHGKPAKPPYHNKQFREKCREYGLIVDDKGCTTHEPGRFIELLKQHGIDTRSRAPVAPPKSLPKMKGSKLVKWSCECTNVRVAVPDFDAQCNRCGGQFKRQA